MISKVKSVLSCKSPKGPDKDLLDEIDIESFIESWGKEELYCDDFYIAENIYVPLAIYGSCGSIILVLTDKKGGADLTVRRFFGLNVRQMILILHDGEKVTVNRFGDIYSAEDIEDITLLEIDRLKGRNARFTGKEPIIRLTEERIDDETLTRIYALTTELEGKDIQKKDKDVFTDEDGTVYVKKYRDKRFLGISTGLIEDKEWYELSVIDERIYALKTAVFGFLGVHKFIVGEILQGLLYALTCGGGGLLPFLDVLSIICGEYRYKQNSYYEDGTRETSFIYVKRLKDLRIAVLCIAISIFTGFFMTRIVYINLLEKLSVAIGAMTESASRNNGFGGMYGR
jgi:hypothetical protein